LPEDILAVTDRMSMHHSLEVRVPFLDHRLVEFCATIPPELKMKWFKKKYLLRKAVCELLPREVMSHRKQGFASPMAKWLQKDLRSFVLDVVTEKNINKHGFLNYKAVNGILDDHFRRKEINDKLIWSILIFQVWFDTYMR
jgi:asparagine synthase (glutamine-hydrolysing)